MCIIYARHLTHVAAAAGEAVAEPLSSSLMLPSVAGAGLCNVVAYFLVFPSGD